MIDSIGNLASKFQHTAARRRLADFPGSYLFSKWFQHTAARRRLDASIMFLHREVEFQHTAARRRLAPDTEKVEIILKVSTHSRPKAAGCPTYDNPYHSCCFNTQPPEGGWYTHRLPTGFHRCFNTQPPEGGWQTVR